MIHNLREKFKTIYYLQLLSYARRPYEIHGTYYTLSLSLSFSLWLSLALFLQRHTSNVHVIYQSYRAAPALVQKYRPSRGYFRNFNRKILLMREKSSAGKNITNEGRARAGAAAARE